MFQLKGRKFNKKEMSDLIKSLKLDVEKNQQARSMSGGQKRKLSLAIALIGGSEVRRFH